MQNNLKSYITKGFVATLRHCKLPQINLEQSFLDDKRLRKPTSIFINTKDGILCYNVACYKNYNKINLIEKIAWATSRTYRR